MYIALWGKTILSKIIILETQNKHTVIFHSKCFEEKWRCIKGMWQQDLTESGTCDLRVQLLPQQKSREPAWSQNKHHQNDDPCYRVSTVPWHQDRHGLRCALAHCSQRICRPLVQRFRSGLPRHQVYILLLQFIRQPPGVSRVGKPCSKSEDIPSTQWVLGQLEVPNRENWSPKDQKKMKGTKEPITTNRNIWSSGMQSWNRIVW